MSETKESLLHIVNSSGFLFQLAVEREIKQINFDTWTIASTEHRWEDPKTGNESFIDIVLQSTHGIGRMIIECKRVQNGHWIFLVEEDQIRTSKAKLLWSTKTEVKGEIINWDDMCYGDYSYQSSFCIVRGQGENDRPMLERLAGQVLRSNEALAIDEMHGKQAQDSVSPLVYIPVIVTNALLKVCKFKPDDIEIETGKIIEEACFETVPFIKFRKNLSSFIQNEEQRKSIYQINESQQRTTFIVNVQHLKSFLEGKLEPYKKVAYSFGNGYPWERI